MKTPPMSREARIEAGNLLQRLQDGESLGMPHSRPMPTIGPRCHELRITDKNRIWRVIYQINPDAILVVRVFSKTTQKTEQKDIDVSKQRLADHWRSIGRIRKQGEQ